MSTAGKTADYQTDDEDVVPEPPLSGHLFKITGLKCRGYAPYRLRCLLKVGTATEE